MGRNMRHLLMFLLIILKEPNMPEADCSCPPTPPLRRLHLTSIPQNLLTSTCWLFLSRNQIKIIQPGAFSNLPQLQLLDLTSNQITLIKPDTFINLPRLKMLVLNSNNITMIQEGTFENLPQLEELFLNRNQITMLQPGAFVNLPRLQELVLERNQIKMLQPGTFANLPRLQRLFLYNNQITMIRGGLFANLPQLQYLDLGNNKMSAITPLAYGLSPSKLVIKLLENPWLCDCKMTHFRQNTTEFTSLKDQIICTQPAKFRGKKLTDVNPEELVCAVPTIPALPVDVTLTSNGYNGTTAGTTKGPAGEKNKPRTTIASPLQTTSDKPESKTFHPDKQVTSKNYYNGTTKGPGGKRGKTRATKSSAPQTTSDRLESVSSKEAVPSLPIPVLIGSVCGSIAGLALVGTVILTIWCKRRTNNSPSDPSSGPNIALSNLNMTGTVVINGHYYRTEQDHDHQYEDIDQHNQTRQGQSQAITQSNKNITATVITCGYDHQYEDMAPQHNQTGQGQSQATTESNPNTTASVGSSDHGQSTAQGHPQAITEFKNPSYGTGHIASMQSALYKVVGQSQAITEPNPNTTASVEASDDGQSTGQGHRQAIIELKIPSYGTGQIVSMQSPLYKVVGPSHAITESNTNTTAAVIPSVLDQQYENMAPQHNQTGQGQSHAITESNPNTTATVMTSGLDQQYEDMAPQHNQTGQGQSQAINESNPNTTATVMTSGYDHWY